MKLRIAGIEKESVVDGPGIRYVIFTQGCFHNCQGCHNPKTHDINGGYELDISDIINDINKSAFINGVTFSGGEPFLQAEALFCLAQELKARNLNIISYSGYVLEELINSSDSNIRKLLDVIDILIDGKFVLSERDISLKFRGSRNQRIIDINKSMQLKLPVLMEL